MAPCIVAVMRLLSEADPEICAKGPFLPFHSLPLPLKVAPLNRLGGLGSPARSGAEPGRKRIWCTLKLSETHHFEYSQYHVLRV